MVALNSMTVRFHQGLFTFNPYRGWGRFHLNAIKLSQNQNAGHLEYFNFTNKPQVKPGATTPIGVECEEQEVKPGEGPGSLPYRVGQP